MSKEDGAAEYESCSARTFLNQCRSYAYLSRVYLIVNSIRHFCFSISSSSYGLLSRTSATFCFSVSPKSDEMTKMVYQN
ncbi:hypothetical protein ACFX2I_026375 [Malus domestica]